MTKNHPRTSAAAPRPQGPELSINRRAEPAFRRWLLAQFLENPTLQYATADILDDGAEYVGVSQDTISRYLGKVTSRYGLYRRARNEGGTEYVELRPENR